MSSKIYVVLGMHKSGTTLVAQTLHNSGIDMVESAGQGVSYDDGNKYERESVLALNMEMLGIEDYEVRELAKPGCLCMTEGQRERMRAIIHQCEAGMDDWGFKEPRSVFTYPLWLQELPQHYIIAIYRSPDEIWPRFRWRGLRRRYINPLWAWQFLSRWMEHNLAIIQYLRDAQGPYLLMEYGELMTGDAELLRLQSFVGRSLSDMRRKDLYRTRKPRVDLSLVFANWLMKKKTGSSSADVLRELDELRMANIPAGRWQSND